MSMMEIILMDKRIHGTFWSQVQFLFFSNRRPLKFPKMKCNPTNVMQPGPTQSCKDRDRAKRRQRKRLRTISLFSAQQTGSWKQYYIAPGPTSRLSVFAQVNSADCQSKSNSQDRLCQVWSCKTLVW